MTTSARLARADDVRRYLLLDSGGGVHTAWKTPLTGAIRRLVVPIADPRHPGASLKCWTDDSGDVRRLLGCSDFCLVTDWQYHTAIAKHNITYAAKFFHYVRTFRRLGESASGGYYGPRSALMPWCIPAFWDAVEYGARYDMRWQVSHGYQYRAPQERLDFEGAWAHEGQRRGLSQYLFLVELDNEWWQNSWLRYDHLAARAEAKQVEHLWRSIFDPCPVICMGAPEAEGPNQILESVLSDRVCEIHTARDREAMSKHVFALWWMEGNPGKLVVEQKDKTKLILDGVHYVCGEPTPMAGGPDDFMGTPNPGAQFAQCAMTGQIGTPNTYFDGNDVRDVGPIEANAPTMESHVQFLANVPEDACTWPPDHGGTIWHWRRPSSHEAVTVLDEVWLQQLLREQGGEGPAMRAYRPPRPWTSWTAYGCSVDRDGGFHPEGCAVVGVGGEQPLDVLRPGFGGCLIHGELP